MNNKTKVVLWTIVALLAISLMLRFVVLSQAGVAGGWIFYLGLPIGGIVALILLLLRLGLLNFGETVQGSAAPASPAAPTSQRLQELDALRTSGAISDTEYAAKRARIISGI
jgi:uncharacterized membrane protein